MQEKLRRKCDVEGNSLIFGSKRRSGFEVPRLFSVESFLFVLLIFLVVHVATNREHNG